MSGLLVKRILMLLLALHAGISQANIASYFNQIKQDPNALYAFFKAMPKGGELHYHLSGGAYPETMLDMALKEGFCLDKETFAVTSATACQGIQLDSKLITLSSLYFAIIRAWSLKDFIPGTETSSAHFFSSFYKFSPLVDAFESDLLVSVIQRAADQKELYLEVMIQPDKGKSLDFASLIAQEKDLAKKRQILLENAAFRNNIVEAVAGVKHLEKATRAKLQCQSQPASPACQIKVQFQAFVLREFSLDKVFAQALTAFETVAAAKAPLVAVNLVQNEASSIALRDYKQQMALLNFLHGLYPQVSIALHAGELTPDSVVPEALNSPIHDAIFVGHAQRIGHGLSIAYENDLKITLPYMAKQAIPVEINLVSNRLIWGVSGVNHPLHFYLDHKVPLVLSTDDEGVLRTDLTRQYVAAVLEQGLDYETLKQMNRNTLSYAFLPGKSIWAQDNTSELVTLCKELQSKTCQAYVQDSPKAQLQWALEIKLAAFEQTF